MPKPTIACTSAQTGRASNLLPAFQTHRDTGVCRDPTILRDSHSTVASNLGVVGSSLQSEPFGAAVLATHWFIGGRRQLLSSPII